MNKLEMNLKPCRFCMSARVQPPAEYDEGGYPINGERELTDENDFSSIGVGSAADGYGISINAGHGTPVNISFHFWDEKFHRNIVVGSYFPKFCPECGRPLAEYDPDWVKYGLQCVPYELRYWMKAKGLLELEPKYFSSLMTIFETWQPDDASYRTATKTACLKYANNSCLVFVSADGIQVYVGATRHASFQHKELDNCLNYLEGCFAVLMKRSAVIISSEPAIPQDRPTNLFSDKN